MAGGATLSLILALALGIAGPPVERRELLGVRTVPAEPIPQVGLAIDLPRLPQAGIYRQIGRDTYTHPPIVGPYPAEALAARREGDVGLRLIIDGAGRVTECSITQSSGERSMDAYSCPYVRTRAYLSPALDSRGVRRGGVVTARLFYTLSMESHGPETTLPFPDPIRRPARPRTPVTAETLGVPTPAPSRDHFPWFSVWLAIDNGGRVTACTLARPTFVDRLDRRICDRLRHTIGFVPATGTRKSAVSSLCYLHVDWPDSEPPPANPERERATNTERSISCRSSS
jgi:TonB family protein